FSSRRRHTRFSRDWSSDVCSSDLTCKRNTLSVNCGVNDHASAVQHRSMDDVGFIEARALQPVCPIGSAIQVYQRKLENIRDLVRSEERRVGKEWRCGLWPCHYREH